MRRYLVEFIGTFFLVLTLGMVVLKPHEAGAAAPLAIGAVLMAMVYAGGHVSGAHYNPAVTLAIWLRGRCPTRDVLPYVAAQLAGALAAAGAVLYMKGNPPVEVGTFETGRALLAEFLFTFALCWVVLNVATARTTAGNSYYGLAIGFTVLAGAFAVGPVSGAAFNPAVAVGITVMGLVGIANLATYIVAQLLAGALAAYVFRAMLPDDR